MFKVGFVSDSSMYGVNLKYMTRRKISEYHSKVLVSKALGGSYYGWTIDLEKDTNIQLSNIDRCPYYVIKVDQGVKGRYKKGLVSLNVTLDNVRSELDKYHKMGFKYCLIEPQVIHPTEDERYIAFSRQREGVRCDYNLQGGVNIEAYASEMQSRVLTDSQDWADVVSRTGLTKVQLQNLVNIFNEGFMTMLEINPYIIDVDGIKPLDAAIEVDDAGSYFTNLWSEEDFRYAPSATDNAEELIVRKLDEKSPSSLKLEVINSDGSIFLLLSGGGASVVIADEIYNLGFGGQLANYGEYSGNPNVEETYIYTLSVLKLLVASKAEKKVLFIGGAVANFTDIANTFEGIIKAIDELSSQLSQHGVKIYVRRGGPRQEIGLERIRKSLEEHGLLGAVYGPSTPITNVVAEVVKEIAE